MKPAPPRLLLVEDDLSLRHVMTLELSALGFDVIAVDGARKAISTLKCESVDLIVSDLVMAQGTGIDLLKWLRCLGSEYPPTILMTGLSEQTVGELKELGAAAMMRKPFDPDQFDTLFRDFLDQYYSRTPALA